MSRDRPCASMRRRPLLVLQLSLHPPVFLLETSQQTDCTSTFVPSPSRSRSLLFLKGRGGGGQPHSVYPTIIPRQRKKKNKQLRSFLRLHLLWHRLSLPTGLYPPVGVGGGGWSRGAAPAGGDADGQMPRRLSAERCCRQVVRTRRRIQGFWRCTMGGISCSHSCVRAQEHLNLLETQLFSKRAPLLDSSLSRL